MVDKLRLLHHFAVDHLGMDNIRPVIAGDAQALFRAVLILDLDRPIAGAEISPLRMLAKPPGRRYTACWFTPTP